MQKKAQIKETMKKLREDSKEVLPLVSDGINIQRGRMA